MTRIPEKGFGLRHAWFYFAAVIATSGVAWLATEPLILYHFSQFSSYSLLANTLADPLVSFILMPLVIAGVLLMPLHLGWLAFTPMQYGVDWLVSIAHFVASLPHAMWIWPGPTDAGFVLVAFAFCWIYFWQGRVRWLGLAPLLAGLATSMAYVPPDMFIGGDGKHAAIRLDNGDTVMLRGKSGSVLAGSWARAALVAELKDKDDRVTCDRLGCVAHAKGRTVAVLRGNDTLQDECALSDIIVTESAAPGACTHALLFDETSLERFGATTLWLKGDHVVRRSVREEQGDRPWANNHYNTGK